MSKRTKAGANKSCPGTAREPPPPPAPQKKDTNDLPIILHPERLFTRQKEANFPSARMNATKEYNPRMWPSSRVPQGGLFNERKFQYSQETTDLIRLLVKESKMSTMMRKNVDYFLRNGEPFQQPKHKSPAANMNPNKEAAEILKRAQNSKRKSLNAIVASGAYDTPNYRPKPTDRLPSEKSKAKLQESMSGCSLPLTDMKVKRRAKYAQEEITYSNDDLINDLLEQINERADWLAEMESLGQGKKYRDEIREQIAERLRHIRSLERKIELRNRGICYID